MTTDNRTNEQIVKLFQDALRGEDEGGDMRVLVNDLHRLTGIAAGRLAREPGEEQVERAARAFYASAWLDKGAGLDDTRTGPEVVKDGVRAALTAAGVAPMPWDTGVPDGYRIVHCRGCLEPALAVEGARARCEQCAEKCGTVSVAPQAVSTERVMDTLAYYHCRSVNPKADHPRMGYHAMSEDQREFLRERQREAAEEVMRMFAASSQPLPTVDEGELEHRIEEAVRDVVDMPLSTRLVLAHAVAAWLKGQGR